MRIARVTVLLWIMTAIPSLACGQCPIRDSIIELTAKIQEPGVDLKKLLPKILEYVDQNAKCAKRDDSVGAKLLRSTGVVYYKLGELDQAIKFNIRSIELARTIKKRVSLRDSLLLDAYLNLYYFYNQPSQIQSRIEAIDSCMAVELRLNSDFYITCSLIGDKAEYLLYKGDYTGCIRVGELGQSFNSKYAPLIKARLPKYDSITTDFTSFTYRIDGLIFLGEFRKAEVLLKEKLDFFKKINYTYNLGVLYNLIGNFYYYQGDYQLAKQNFILSCKVNLQEKYNKGYIQSMGKLGMIYNQQIKIPDSALYYCKQALRYSDKVDSIFILDLIGNAYAQKGNYDLAFLHYRKAYEKLGLGSEVSTELVSKLNDEVSQKVIEYITGLLMDYGTAKLLEYKTKKVLRSIEEAINIFTITDHVLSRIKIEYSERDTKLFWRSHSRRLYEFAIEACYLADQKQKAFYFLEKGRAVLLHEQLNDQRWLNNDQILQQKSMADLIKKQEKEITTIDQSSSEYLKRRTELVSNQEKLKDLTQRLRENNPLYYQNYLDTAIIRISDVQQKILSGNGSFVELFVGDSSVYIMAITEREIFFNRINKFRYESLLKELKEGIIVPTNSVHAITNLNQKSRELYALLFSGIGFAQPKLIISPDGQIFPFEVLVTNNSGAPKYLIEDHPISYTYSARYLLNSFTNSANSRGNLLGFAPIRFPNANNSLAQLIGSDESLEHLKQYCSNTSEYVGAKATKNNFLKIFPGYSVIQLYTHASASSEANEPVIYFSDSILYLSELVPEIKPSTQLIVLAACETGKGQVYEGEGTFSFNRAFAAIGIPAAVTTLWSVETESTYRITELFYKYLSEGNPTDIALQKAKIEFLKSASKEKALPYYWAGPILSGKTEKIEFSQGNYWKWIGIGAGLLLITILILVMKQKARAKMS